MRNNSKNKPQKVPSYEWAKYFGFWIADDYWFPLNDWLKENAALHGGQWEIRTLNLRDTNHVLLAAMDNAEMAESFKVAFDGRLLSTDIMNRLIT